MALKIYIKARATPKVVAAFAERREFDKILIYSKQVLPGTLGNANGSEKKKYSVESHEAFVLLISGGVHPRLLVPLTDYPKS